MAFRVIDALCQRCFHKEEMLIDKDEMENEWECPACGGVMKRTISAPTVLNASFLDGTKREGFSELKEAARLKVAMADMTPEQRKSVKAEIKKMGVKSDI